IKIKNRFMPFFSRHSLYFFRGDPSTCSNNKYIIVEKIAIAESNNIFFCIYFFNSFYMEPDSFWNKFVNLFYNVFRFINIKWKKQITGLVIMFVSFINDVDLPFLFI